MERDRVHQKPECRGPRIALCGYKLRFEIGKTAWPALPVQAIKVLLKIPVKGYPGRAC